MIFLIDFVPKGNGLVTERYFAMSKNLYKQNKKLYISSHNNPLGEVGLAG